MVRGGAAARAFAVGVAVVVLGVGAPAGSASAAAAGAMAPMPADLHCGAVKPVWVNTKTHVYHTSTDPEYGRTKSGMYMCASAAVKAGNRRAGNTMTMPAATPAPRS